MTTDTVQTNVEQYELHILCKVNERAGIVNTLHTFTGVCIIGRAVICVLRTVLLK